MTSTITRAGQTTVPAEVRRKLGWPPQTTVDWQLDGDKAVVRRMRPLDDVPLVKLRRVNGRLMLPKGLKLDREQLARDVREERDGR